MDDDRLKVYEHYRGVILAPDQLRGAFKELADLASTSVQAVDWLVQSLDFRKVGYRTEDDPVYVMEHDAFADLRSPLTGLKVTVYSIDDGMNLLCVRTALPLAESEPSYDVQLAERLGLPQALDGLQVDLPTQFVPKQGGMWQFRCDLAPLIEGLSGFDPCPPNKISAMTAEVAANEGSMDLEIVPRNPLHRPGPAYQKVLADWGGHLNRWQPTWTFASPSQLLVRVRLVGWARPYVKGLRVGPLDCPIPWPQASVPYRVQGSILYAAGKGEVPETPVLSVDIRHSRTPHDHPYPLPLMGDVQVSARELATALATIDLH